MKNYLKTLVALLLLLTCIFACVSCNNETPGPSDGTDNDSGNNDVGETPEEEEKPNNGVVRPPVVDILGDETEKLRIRFVYSYTAKVVNNNGRTENKKEVVTVGSVYVDKDNNGLTDEQLEQINNLSYHGFTFEKWYTEWDKEEQVAIENTEYTFDEAKITEDLVLYGFRGDYAGSDAHWELEFIYEEEKKDDAVVGASDETLDPPALDTDEEGTEEEPEVTPDEEPEEEKKIKEITLRITGEGDMFNFANANEIDVPWYKYSNLITKVIVEDGITSIGSNAFCGFTKLKSVELPDSVTSIGEFAFKGFAVKSFSTPANLKYIGKNAFANTPLTKVVLNEGLETIDERGFYGSNKIKSIVVPTTLKSVANAVFNPGSSSSYALKVVFYSGDADSFKNIEIQMDNGWFHELSTIYYYKETPADYGEEGSEEIIGNYWHYAEGTDVAVQYCYTLNYIQGATDFPFHTIFVPARPTYDEAGELIVDDDGVPILAGEITAEHVVEQANITYHNFKFESFSGTALKVGDVITGDKTITCNRGKILSEDGGIKFNFTTYPNDTRGYITIYKDAETENRIRADIASRIETGLVLSDAEEKYLAQYLAGEGADDAAIEAQLAVIEERVNSDEGLVLSDEEAEAIIQGRLSVAFRIWDFVESGDTNVLWLGSMGKFKNVAGVVIEEGVEYIGKYALNGIGSMTEIILPASLKEIHPTALDSCPDLVSVYYSASIAEDCPTLADIGGIRASVYSYVEESVAEEGSFWTNVNGVRVAWTLDAGKLAVGGADVMPDFASVGDTPWYNAKDSITSISFAKNIVSIGENVVNGFANITAISLPNGLRRIPESAFAGTGIVNDTSKYDKGILVVNGYLLKVDATKRNTSLFETYTGINVIADGAFARCDKIERIYIAGTVRYINSAAFDGTKLEYVFYDADDASWNGVASDLVLDGVKVLYKSAKRPSQNIYDDAGNFVETKYIDGQHWFKLGNDYAVWGCMHIWSEWEETLAPTCCSVGTRTRYCIYDASHIENEDIAMLTEHTFGEYIPDNNATCYTLGTETAHCTVEGCEAATEPREIPDSYLDHVFNVEAYVYNNDVTCDKNGTKSAPCATEGCEKIDTIDDPDHPAVGHAYGEFAFDEGSATCLKPYGDKSKTCSNVNGDGTICGHKITEVVLEGDPLATAPQGHVYEDVVDDKYFVSAPTKDSPAIYNKSCKWCGVASTDTFEYGAKLSFYSYDDIDTLVAGKAPILTTSSSLTLNSVDEKGVYVTLAEINGSKALKLGAGDREWLPVEIANTNNQQVENPVHVIDTKFMIESFEFVGGSDAWISKISLSNGSSNVAEIYFRVKTENSVYVQVKAGGVTTTYSDLVIETGVMYDFYFEYVDGETDSYKISIKPIAASEFETREKTDIAVENPTGTFQKLVVELRGTSSNYVKNTAFVFDDTYFATVKAAE